MTADKTSKAIENLKTVHKLYDVVFGDWSFCYTAIEALEKQIPKKVEEAKGIHKQSHPLQCPTCKSSFRKDSNKYAYCPVCGQRLEW